MSKGPRQAVVSHLNPGLSLDAIGRVLASAYDDLVAEGIPEHLAALVRRVERAQGGHRRERLVVVVEDDAQVRALAEAILEETDLRVIGCETAEEALDCLKARGDEIALVFADVRLAGHMDGAQLARAVATLWPTTRLVVTSGMPLEDFAPLPAETVFIPKPWTAVALLSEAERATDGARPAVA